MLILLLALAVLLAGYAGAWHLRATATAKRAVHFELTPTGSGSLTLEDAGDYGRLLLNTLAKEHGTLTIHRFHTGGVTRTALTLAGFANPDMTAKQIAAKVGATATRTLELPLPTTAAYATAVRGDRGGRTALGETLDGFANAVISEFETGEGDAFVSTSVVAASTRARHRVKDWLETQIGDGENGSTHPLMAAPIIARTVVVAGAPSDDLAARLAGTAATIPGCDTDITTKALTDAVVYKLAGPAAVLAAAGVFTGHLPVLTAAALGVPALAALGVAASSPAPIRQTLTQGFLGAGVVPMPAAGPMRATGLSVRGLVAFTIAQTVGRKWSWAKPTAKPVHPFPAGVLALAPQQVVALLATGEVSVSVTTVTTTKVPAPTQMREVVGVRLGYDIDGHGVNISDKDRGTGVFIAGDPGRGKTQELLYLWAGDLLARRYHPLGGDEPLRGGRTSMLWFETKGEGAERVLAISEKAHTPREEVVVLSASATTGPRLELFDRSRPEASARAFVGALTYALNPGDIAGASKDTLTQVLTLALHTPDTVIAQAYGRGFLPVRNASPIDIAHVLAGGRVKNNSQAGLFELLRQEAALTGPATGTVPEGATSATASAVDDFEAMFAAATDSSGPSAAGVSPFQDAVDDWAYIMDLPVRERRAHLKAPLNKLSDLRGAPNLWRPAAGREEFTLADLVTGHRVAILDMSIGTVTEAADGETVGEVTGDALAGTLAAISLNLLQVTIQQHCSGWQEQGRAVAFYCDELPDVAGKGTPDSDVVAWMFDKGRAFGVQMNVACQRWQQLPDRVAQAARSATTLIYLGLGNHATASEAFPDVASDASPYTVEDLRNLPLREAICRTAIDGDRQRVPFTLLVEDDRFFDADTYYEQDRIAHHGPEDDRS